MCSAFIENLIEILANTLDLYQTELADDRI